MRWPVSHVMRFLMLLAVGGCVVPEGSGPQNWIDAVDPAARILLVGDNPEISAHVELAGPAREGAPYEIGGTVINDFDTWDILAEPVMTTGDQAWREGATVFAVATTRVPTDALRAHCGRIVHFQFTFGTHMADDDHLEGAGALVDLPVDCR